MLGVALWIIVILIICGNVIGWLPIIVALAVSIVAGIVIGVKKAS